jgi:hypothetical protein
MLVRIDDTCRAIGQESNLIGCAQRRRRGGKRIELDGLKCDIGRPATCRGEQRSDERGLTKRIGH